MTIRHNWKFVLTATALAAWVAIGCTAGSLAEIRGRDFLRPSGSLAGAWLIQEDYSDEFYGSSLEARKWDSDVYDWGFWSWEPDNILISDGFLHVRMQYKEHERAGKSLHYKSGIIKSKAPPILYGYFEARIRGASRYPGVCPAFWAYRDTKGLWTEIDFVELSEHIKSINIIDTNTHVFAHPDLATGKQVHESRNWRSPWDPRDDFHVYGCEWDREYIKWYIDGEFVNLRKNEFWHQPLDVVVSFGVRSPLDKRPSAEGFPTEFLVDYVRVWKKGE